MPKSIVITLEADIPETELNKAASVVVGALTYKGIIAAIISHVATTPPTSKLTLEGAGLKVSTSAP